MGVRYTTATVILLTGFNFISLISATCYSQSPVFLPPTYNSKSDPELVEAFRHIEESVSSFFATRPDLNTSSYSIEVTSPDSTLWSTFHTAAEKDPERPGAEQVDGSSVYRVASITKVFTVLGILQQHAAGNLSLDDPVDMYIPALTASRFQQGGTRIPWGDITLRSLASQLSGIPRDWAQSDLITSLPDPSVIGLPPLPPSAPERSDLPKCDSYRKYKPCTETDLLDYLWDKRPLFMPNQKSTYSNIAFELLGIVLATVTGRSYEDYIEASILGPLKMTSTSFRKPSDSVAVLPKDNAWYWDVDEGVQNPTGGLYSPSSDMSVFLRHVLKTYRNVAGSRVSWLLPVSFTPGWKSFYGMPWEILRADGIVTDSPARTVSFFTKGGGLPGYRTLILLVPEYELGITIFTAGDEAFIDQLVEMVTIPLIRAADRLAGRQAEHRYTGTFVADPGMAINSSLQLSYSDAHGLEITKWISNSTDMLSVIPLHFHLPQDRGFHLQLVPTSLYRNQKRMQGELWRVMVTLDRSGPRTSASPPPLLQQQQQLREVQSSSESIEAPEFNVKGKGSSKTNNDEFLDHQPSGPLGSNIWEDFCVSDVDTLMYAGKPFNEIVFWDDRDISAGGEEEGEGVGGNRGDDDEEQEQDGVRYGTVELTAFRINMTRCCGG
ncbi:uncharacterized protein Z520_11284 [Fonsecaea multimorphosa CBS 102226]|uniref:Uncharacterized protein n=1 Tax=Fonsecaea multimorphosa CBS 102226 TaxID=1442371 RepID=A0A0D2I712_9EURO|nr:uncharacterized protein Z520_11284 [Fonsecaea multimorphosa CBS 102226]KIX93011.1 hypothetical protein Z520_11284 [Fonsecaea multimorphosa CBS 102226]OAL18260.1 hypothetical protein AYO22_10838 [Fonsecaea multimorphosa]